MEDERKLIAKIQHFYDVMIRRIEEVETLNISNFHHTNSHMKQDAEELRTLASEYSRVFEDFLYREGE